MEIKIVLQETLCHLEDIHRIKDHLFKKATTFRHKISNQHWITTSFKINKAAPKIVR
jgi:hypothetical protein